MSITIDDLIKLVNLYNPGEEKIIRKAYESNSYSHEELIEMQNYAIYRMNNYLERNYKKSDKMLKKERNNVVRKTTE